MSSTQRATGWKSIAAACGAFAFGFLAVAFLVHLAMREPQYLHADIRSEKLALLRRWSGTAYSASFGSSHVHNGFDPRAFDSTLAGSPLQSRTVNLAIAGGSQTEQRMTALEFLRYLQPPPSSSPQACMVLLELAAGANFTTDHLVHPRAINIYDWPTTQFALQLTSPKMTLRQRFGRTGYAWAAMALHYMNVGMLSSRIFKAPLDQEMLHDETADDRRGILVLPPLPGMLPQLQNEIAEAPKQTKITSAELLPGNAWLIDELEDASPVRNLQAVYIVMPMLRNLVNSSDYPDTIETAHGAFPIVNLARPERYPQLYQAQLWREDSHLNEAGAKMATKLLAEELKRWYSIHGGPAACERK